MPLLTHQTESETLFGPATPDQATNWAKRIPHLIGGVMPPPYGYAEK